MGNSSSALGHALRGTPSDEDGLQLGHSGGDLDGFALPAARSAQLSFSLAAALPGADERSAGCMRRQISPPGDLVSISADGRTATSQCDEPVPVLAGRTGGDEGEAVVRGGARGLPQGCQFEVKVESKSATSADFTVGLVRDVSKVGPHTLKRMWGYGAAGQLREPGRCTNGGAPVYREGDTVRVLLDAGAVTFFINGQPVTEQPVPPGAFYPVVWLPCRGDSATVALRVSVTSIPRHSEIWGVGGDAAAAAGARRAQADPLHSAFDHDKLRRHYPAATTAAAAADPEDAVQPWLVEQHLWGPGLSSAVLSAEAGKVVKAIHARLTQHTDSQDAIRRVAEARSNLVALMRDEILLDAKKTTAMGHTSLDHHTGGAGSAKIAESRCERTSKAVSSGSFKMFLLITSSVMKTDPDVAQAALQTMRETIESIESGVLAPNHRDRPTHISEDDLDSVNRFLHSLLASTDQALGQLAASCVLLLADRRGQARHYFHAIQTLNTTSAAQAEGAAHWAQELAVSTLSKVLAATAALPDADIAAPATGADANTNQSTSSLSRPDLLPGTEEAAAEGAVAAKWCYLENALSGMVLEIEGGSSLPKAGLWMANKDTSPGQLWMLLQDGRLVSQASDCVLSVATTTDDAPVVSRTRLCMLPDAGPTSKNQRWRVTETDQTNWSFLECDSSDVVLDVEDGSRRVRSQVWMYDKNGTPAQAWRLTPVVDSDQLQKKESLPARWVIDPSAATFRFLNDLIKTEWIRLQDPDSLQLGTTLPIANQSLDELITLVRLLRLNVEAVVPNSPETFTAYDIPHGVHGNVAGDGGSVGLDFDVIVPVTLTSFGVFDHACAGLTTTLQVSIWCRDTQKEVGPRLSFTVEEPGILSGGARFKALDEPLHLSAGFRGCIVAWGYGGQQLFGSCELGNQPYPVNDGNGAITFAGTSRTGAEAAHYPPNQNSGGCFKYLAGTFKFSVGSEATIVGQESPDNLLENANTIVDSARLLVDHFDEVGPADLSDSQTRLWQEACSLLRAAATLVYSSTSSSRHELMIRTIAQAKSLSTMLITDGLLGNVASVGEALSLLSTAANPFENLEHTDEVMDTLSQLFATIGFQVQDAVDCTPRTNRIAHCDMFGIISVLAKIQAGVLVNYVHKPTLESQTLLDRYTSLLAIVATQQVQVSMTRPDPLKYLETGVVAGLAPSWVAALGSLQWNLFCDDTVKQLATLYDILGQLIEATELQDWSPRSEKIPWVIDLHLSLGYYAITKLMRLGIEDVGGTPRDQAPAFAQRLLQGGRVVPEEADEGWKFLSGVNGRSDFVARVAEQAGLPAPTSDTEEDLTVVAVFKALIYHAGLGRAAARSEPLDLRASRDSADDLPIGFITALELANDHVQLEREVSSELDLARTTSVRNMNLQRQRAQFLMQFSTTASDFSAAAEAASVMDAGDSLQRQVSNSVRSRLRNSTPVRRRSVSAHQELSPELRSAMEDIKQFVTTDKLDLEAVGGEINHVEKLAKLRAKSLKLVLRFVSAGSSSSFASIQMRRRMSILLFRGDESVFTHFLAPFAGCGPQITSELTECFFSIVSACVGATSTDISTFGGVLACTWKAEDCQNLQTLRVWDTIDQKLQELIIQSRDLSVDISGLLQEKVLLARALQLSSTLSVAAMDVEVSRPLIQEIVDGFVTRMTGPSDVDISSVLPCLPFLLPNAAAKVGAHVLTEEANLVNLLNACFCVLIKSGSRLSSVETASTLLLLRRLLHFASPEQANTGLARAMQRSGQPVSILEYFAKLSQDGLRQPVFDWSDPMRDCSQVSALGLESGDVSNAAFTASNSIRTSARLNGTTCWVAQIAELEQGRENCWLQVDLGQQILCTGVRVQGSPDTEAWVKSYVLSYSLDGHVFADYLDSGSIATFTGNSDATTATTQKLMNPVVTRFLRLHPVEAESVAAVRLEVLGVKDYAPTETSCQQFATSIMIELASLSVDWATACTTYAQSALDARQRDGTDCSAALSLCGGFAETIRSGALATLHGSQKRILDVDKETAVLLDPTYGSVSVEQVIPELQPQCTFHLDISVLDSVISLCSAALAKHSQDSDSERTHKDKLPISWRENKECMLTVRAVGQFATSMKQTAAVRIAQRGLFRPLLSLSIKAKPTAGLESEIIMEEERMAILAPKMDIALDSIHGILSGTTTNIRADMATIAKFTFGPAHLRTYMCESLAKSGAAKVAILCLEDCLVKLYAGDTSVHVAEPALHTSTDVDKRRTTIRITKIWHPEAIRWGNCGVCQICILDKGEPVVASREEYEAIAQEQGGRIPGCQYPGAGNAYSHGSNERSLYDAATRVAQETLHANFPEATTDSILVLHGNLDDGWAHSNEAGSMHAWKAPSEDCPEVDTYAWCRGGASASKRFHVFVCADCDSPPGLSSQPPPKVESLENNQAPADGLDYLMAGVATLENTALYTETDTAKQVSECGAVAVLGNLLKYFEQEKLELPPPASEADANAAAAVMVKVRIADGGEEYVESNKLFLVEPLPTLVRQESATSQRAGMQVVATRPSRGSGQWWAATVRGVAAEPSDGEHYFKLEYDDGVEEMQQPGQIATAVPLNEVPPSGTSVFMITKSYSIQGRDGTFSEYVRTVTVESDQPQAQSLSDVELEPEPESGVPEEDPQSLIRLIVMGFSRAASIRALDEANQNFPVAASLLADIGDAILSQPPPEGIWQIPETFAALMVKPHTISKIVEALYAFSLRVQPTRYDPTAVAVLSRLLRVTTEQADDLFSPVPQLGDRLGLQSGAITDGQIEVSSTKSQGVGRDSDGHAAKFGRLHCRAGVGAWVSAVDDKSQWLQVDLGSLHWVTAVATQGRCLTGQRHSHISQWVTVYAVSASVDGRTWDRVQEYQGNTDSESVVTNQFRTPVEARYVRFLPVAWSSSIAMRVEVFGRDPQRVQTLLAQIKSNSACALANLMSVSSDETQTLLQTNSGVVEDCNRILSDVLNVSEETSEEEEEDSGSVIIDPAFLPEFQSLMSDEDPGRLINDNNCVELQESGGYCMNVLNIPFPKTGRHTAVVRMIDAPENCGVGLVTSYEEVLQHSRGSKAWIGNGENGWCIFKDGDAAHGGRWKGGNYQQYSISNGCTVSVIFDADRRNIGFVSNDRERPDVYDGLPDTVYLAVSLYKRGKFELVSTDWEHITEGEEHSEHRQGSTGVTHLWSKKPKGNSDSVMWLWVFVPGSEKGGVTFKYREAEEWSDWSSQPTNLNNGWWHTAGWNRGYERYEHSCWFNGQQLVDKIHAPTQCDTLVPDSGCFPIPDTKRSLISDSNDGYDFGLIDKIAGPALVTLRAFARVSAFKEQLVCTSGLLPTLLRFRDESRQSALLPGLPTTQLAGEILQLLDVADSAVPVEALGNGINAGGEVGSQMHSSSVAAPNGPEPELESTYELEPEPEFDVHQDTSMYGLEEVMMYPRAWLSNLAPTEKSVGYGEYGVGSDLGYENKQIVSGGTLCMHGISMHPPANGKAFATFVLTEEFRESTFTTEVGINDDVEGSTSPLVFSLLADGNEVWSSQSIQQRNSRDSCEVVLSSVRTLQLEVSCADSNACAHAVWLDTQLTGAKKQHWSATEFKVRSDTQEERGHWKTIALAGGVEPQKKLAVQPLLNRTEIVEATERVKPHRVHSELCTNSKRLIRLYALRSVLNVVQHVSPSDGFMESPEDMDLFINLFEKASMVQFGNDNVDNMISNFVTVLAQQGSMGTLLSKQLQKLCCAAEVASADNDQEISFEVATNCLQEVVSNDDVLATSGAKVLLSESGFVQLVSAACATTGKLRRRIIELFNALCYKSAKYMPAKSLDPALGIHLRRLYWAEYTASDAQQGGFGTRTLNTYANMMIAWSSVPAHVVKRPDWSYHQLQLLEALALLWEECGTEYDISPVLAVDGVYDERTVSSLQSFLNKHLTIQGFSADVLTTDGQFGPLTKTTLQAYLNWRRAKPALSVDGTFDVASKKALATFLNSNWDQAGFRSEPKLKIDGTFDSSTIKAIQTFLNGAHNADQEWRLIFRQRSPSRGGSWCRESLRDGSDGPSIDDINVDEPAAPLFCALDSIPWPQLRDSAGLLTLRLSFPNSDLKPLMWQQQSLPTETEVTGFQALDSNRYAHFQGLSRCADPQRHAYLASAGARGQKRSFAAYSVGALQPWAPSSLPSDTDATVNCESEWDIAGEGEMTAAGNQLELENSSGYSAFVCKVPYPSSGKHTVEIQIVERPENMGIGVCRSYEHLKKHARSNKAWIGNGPNGWCLFNDGDCAHDGSWLGGDYTGYAYNADDVVQVNFDADEGTIGWNVNGKKRGAVYRHLGDTVYFALSFYKRGKARVLNSSFPLAEAAEQVSLAPSSEVSKQPTYGVEKLMLQFYCGDKCTPTSLEGSTVGPSASSTEPHLVGYYNFDVPPGMCGPLLRGHGANKFAELVHEVELEVMVPEKPVARFEKSMEAMHHFFRHHSPVQATADTPCPAFTGKNFLQRFGPWSSAAACIEACGFRAGEPDPTLEPEPEIAEPTAELEPAFLEPEPEPVSESERLSDEAVDPMAETLVAMGFDLGMSRRALAAASGNVETAIELLLNKEIPEIPPDVEPDDVQALVSDEAHMDTDIVVGAASTDDLHIAFGSCASGRPVPSPHGVSTAPMSTITLTDGPGPAVPGVAVTGSCKVVLANPRDIGDTWTIMAWTCLSSGTATDAQVLCAPRSTSNPMSGPVLGAGHVVICWPRVGVVEATSTGSFIPAKVPGNGADYNLQSLGSPSSHESARWYHIAAIGSDGTTKFYVNGEEVGVADAQVTTAVAFVGNAESSASPMLALADFQVLPGSCLDAATLAAAYRYPGRQVAELMEAIPTCTGGHRMFVSEYAGGGYQSGYICNLCSGRSSSGLCNGSRRRWYCSACSDDYCFNCRPEPRVPLAPELAPTISKPSEPPLVSHHFRFCPDECPAPVREELQSVLNEVLANPKILSAYQEHKSHHVEEGTLAMLLLATDAARCISQDQDLPLGLRLERDDSMREPRNEPVPLFPCFETHRVQTRGSGSLTAEGGVFSLSDGHSSDYALCVCDVPFPQTGRHKITVTVEDMGDCAGIGVVTSFEEVLQHSNGSKAWIGNGPHGWCLFNDGDCCHGGTWNSGSQRFGTGKKVSIEIDMDAGTFSPSVDGNSRPNAYSGLPKQLYFAVAMRPSGRFRIDASQCGSAQTGASAATTSSWSTMVQRMYTSSSRQQTAGGEGVAGDSAAASTIVSTPPGWREMELGRWDHKDDVELVMLMNHAMVDLKKPSLDSVLLEDLIRNGTIKKYQRLDGRPVKCIIGRTQVMDRLSAAAQQVLPMVDLIGTSEEGSGAVRKLRTLMLASHKDSLLRQALASVRHTEISMPMIKIDRVKAMAEHDPTGKRSIFGQIYTELGQRAKSGGGTSSIFRGAERWWKVDFLQEHVTDAGGGFRETVSNIAEDLNSRRTPLFIPTPNQASEEGDIRDAWMPNPACTDFERFEFVGRLMSGAIQSQESLGVRWPPFVWKRIARFPCTADDYASSIDASIKHYAAVAACASRDEFELSYEDAFTFSGNNSAEQLVPLIPGGDGIAVTFDNCADFVARLTVMRLGEIDAQCEAIRRGLLSACIPAQVVCLWSVGEFQLAVCGRPEILLAEWKQQTHFENEGPNSSNELFWEVMESFSHEERSRVLKFVTGRIRLPVAFKVEWQSDSNQLPRAATCFQKLYLPRYPTFNKMREKMLIGIQCMAIDTD